MTLLKPWDEKDAKDLAFALNNKNVQDNLRDGLPLPYTEEDALKFISEMKRVDKNIIFPFAIVFKERVIGSIGAFRQANIHARTAELGYYISEDFWGQGIVTQAACEMCGYIFETTDIVRIFAEPLASNAASCRVLEKAGFIFEGTLRKNAFKNGRLLDMKMYALIKE